ncbi:NAD(P)/FAD-dependent oxidoreductase [Alkalihalobacterium alkalinitrilicum]|uniref:NAD(P)/FAD-dependent oxidoreductase n=1 Tax=Alkalihalobacterium alkalinitrilicum TaxID=427920 RepID=UPI0009955411|nr:NAD(P)/FAD-dependent oxidoreductase [Alkalihalobacterium alkalinitrilicum]
MSYDCIIIGGGIAGLQAAIQLGRYNHNIVIIDNGRGRSTLCKEYHNLLGWPDGVSGDYFREMGRKQTLTYGVEIINDTANTISNEENGTFVVQLKNGPSLHGKKLLLATGMTERIPDLDGIYECLGKSIYICPDCDGYEVSKQKTIVIGSGNKGAHLSLILTYWTNDIIYVNYDLEDIDQELKVKLKNKHIPLYQESISEMHYEKEGYISGVTLLNGYKIEANRAFLAMKGTKVNSDIAGHIGVERLENMHINVNPRTKETNVPNVWAVGDLINHSQLLSVAIGDGAQAAIWIHKSLVSS